MSDDPLLRWRAEFPILRSSTYLISNSLGAMPRGAARALTEYAEMWASRGVRAWGESWWEMAVTTGDLIAPLIGARPGEVSMHPNVSLIQAILLSSLDFSGKRNRIVTTALEFPSVLYVYERFASALGARLTIIPSRDGMTVDTDELLDAIDARTRLVAVSHVFFKSSAIADVKAVAAKARRAGALTAIDAYHSVGAIPVDVRRLGVDILAGGVLKWLCGGPGGAFLWMRPSLRRRLSPKITGWAAHERPFDFEPRMRLTPGAMRFLNGTPSIPALYAAREGPRIIARAGIDAVRRKSMRQTAMIVEKARESGWRVATPADPTARAGTVTITVPHAYEVSRELLARDILVDYRRGAGIRMAPHFYTSDREIVSALAEIPRILDSGSWRRHLGRRAVVT